MKKHGPMSLDPGPLTRWNPYLVLLNQGQNPVARQIIGPRGEPTTMILLNGHSIKPNLNGLLS